MEISNYSVSKNPYELKDVKDVHYTERIYYYGLVSDRADLNGKYVIYDKSNDEIKLTENVELASKFEYRNVSFEDGLDDKIKKIGKAKWRLLYIDMEYSRNDYKTHNIYF